MMNVKIKKLDERAIIPTYAHAGDAGMDIYALLDEEETFIAPGDTKFINTGIAMAIPEGFVGLIFPRSGLACKRDLSLANCVGVIDSGYRGEIKVALHNHAESIHGYEVDPFFATQSIKNGERIAQMVIMPFVSANLEVNDNLDDTDRGTGGFGSSGTN